MFFEKNRLRKAGIATFITGLLMIISCATEPMRKDTRSLIEQINAFNFDLPPEIAELSEDDIIEVDGTNFRKSQIVAIMRRAAECKEMLELLGESSTKIVADPHAENNYTVEYREKAEDSNKTRVISGSYDGLLSRQCEAGQFSYFGSKIYPQTFKNLKYILNQRITKASEEKQSAETGLSQKKRKDKAKKLAAYARQYNAIDTSEDENFMLAAAAGDSRFIGKKIVYAGVIGVRQNGYYEVYGFPPILLRATPALNRLNAMDEITILARITDSRQGANYAGQIVQMYTAQVIKILQ
jgi:hypothetical protein